MMPWLRDATVLAAACSSLRLSQDAQGTWRPLASPEDVERAYALMAEILKSREYDAFSEMKRVEETERLRLALHAIVLLALSRGVMESEISSLLRVCLVEMSLHDDPTGGGGTESSADHKLIPLWARRRAQRRLSRCRQQLLSGFPTTPPLSPPRDREEDRANSLPGHGVP